MIYLQLFLSFLQIGAFSFGGGYAALPLIEDQVTNIHSWLSMNEFTNLITISQMTPGPIAINAATFVGIRVAGIAGAVVSTLGCVLPSCLIVTIIAWLYMKYRKMGMIQGILGSLRPAVVAMIASAGISILISAFWNSELKYQLAGFHIDMVAIFVFAFILLRKTKLSPVLIMFISGLIKLSESLILGEISVN